MAHTYGYARVSTTAQNLDAQVDALTGSGGVDERDVVVEKASGRREDRPELARLLAGLRDGDTLVVTKLDRLGRSAAHVARLVRDLDDRGVTLRSLTETIDTSSATGRLMVHVLAAVAQMEADLARERTLDGLAAARARGRVGGRPSVMTPDRVAAARVALAGGQSRAAVARALGVSRDTLYRHLSALDDEISVPSAIAGGRRE
ncbi:recombinase family protein [Cellulosimicrobium funkei]|uniref:Recombinase family protein n=1 Tax=Cellulosimicrobium funkei TaxID=264251 RepID=A0A4Y8QXR5_9MICO|nr:recombinase family protein [Cellulosimicrobium funkei]TFF04447.1 recombinase family protein [Cellulosimicrobium funkei]TGA67888.1 recombinase family protein [Cellulosimicrobium terreum]